MKNLKKLDRAYLRSVNGGFAGDQCRVNLDCGPAGCAICTDFRGHNVCLYYNDPQKCPDLTPLDPID